MNKRDYLIKILILTGLDAYFYIVGITRRKIFLRIKQHRNEISLLDIRIRSREILFAAIICYFTIGAQLNQHHKMSLIIILFCIISLYIYEVIHQFKNDYYDNLLSFFELQGLKILINITRVLSDIIEKYLFDYDAISPFKILFLKGIVEVLLMILSILFNSLNMEVESMLESGENKMLYLIGIIAFAFIYFAVSGFASIYKMFTVKMYTPMTRTLSDILLDIFYFIYFSIYEEEKGKVLFSFYFWVNIIGQIITVFFNFVYNEFIVLNFCGFGINTHYQISKRAARVEMLTGDEEENNIDNESESNENSLFEDLNAPNG